jgi:hypothetical protein
MFGSHRDVGVLNAYYTYESFADECITGKTAVF